MIQAAMALTPEERSRVADVLYDADAPDQAVIDAYLGARANIDLGDDAALEKLEEEQHE